MFAFGAISSITGVDLVSKWRGKYKDLSSAMYLLRKELKDVEGLSIGDVGPSNNLLYFVINGIMHRHNLGHWECYEPQMLRRGDLAIVNGRYGDVVIENPTCGIVDLSGQNIVIRMDRGLLTVPLYSAITMWSVA